MQQNSLPVLCFTCIAILVLATSCRKKTSSFPKDDLRYFTDLLEADMDNDDVLSVLGEPKVDLNAEWAAEDGLHIYQYPLGDSTYVRIGVTDKLNYACVVDEHNNLLEDIIIPGAE